MSTTAVTVTPATKSAISTVFEHGRNLLQWLRREHPKKSAVLALFLAYKFYQRFVRRGVCLRGQIVLITGAGSGLGKLMAKEFARAGSTVVLWDVNGKALEAVHGDIMAEYNARQKKQAEKSRPDEASGGVPSGGERLPCYSYVCDVSDEKSVYTTADRVKHEVGDVNILVNNAGVVAGNKVWEVSEQAVKRTFAVNVFGIFWTLKAFLPAMLRDKRGHIVNIASAGGLVGISRLTDYCASKFATVGVTEALRNELKHTGFPNIRTTLICPFFINTGMFAGVRSAWLMPILDERYVVSRIMRAVRFQEEQVNMPWLVNLVPLLRLLPVSIFDRVCSVLNLNHCMDTFAGRSIDHREPSSHHNGNDREVPSVSAISPPPIAHPVPSSKNA